MNKKQKRARKRKACVERVHWTDESTKHFRYNIASNFISEVVERMEKLKMTQSQLAKKMGVSKARVSRIFNDTGNLTLDSIIRISRILKMRPALVLYADSDIPKRNAPIHPCLFNLCWKKLGKPCDMFEWEKIRELRPRSKARKP